MIFSAESFTSFDHAALVLWRSPPLTSRPTIHWAHATGFSALTYLPILNALAEEMNVTAWDMRGHGLSSESGMKDSFSGWETYYRDMVAMLDASPEPIWLLRAAAYFARSSSSLSFSASAKHRCAVSSSSALTSLNPELGNTFSIRCRNRRMVESSFSGSRVRYMQGE